MLLNKNLEHRLRVNSNFIMGTNSLWIRIYSYFLKLLHLDSKSLVKTENPISAILIQRKAG